MCRAKSMGVMEDAHDLGDLSRCGAIHDEMSPASAAACDVEAAEIGEDFVARDTPWRVGAGFKCRYRVSELDLVDSRLPLAETVGSVERTPFPPRNRRELSSAPSSSVPRSRDSLIANFVEVSDQRRGVSKFFELAAVKRADTELSGGAERCELRRFLHFSVFDETQTFPHDLAGVLITPTLHQGLDQRFLPLGQDNVARRHENTSS
jgi:hypothetical protein